MKNPYTLLLVLLLAVLTACGPEVNDKGEYVIQQAGSGKELHIKFFDNGNIEYIQETRDGKPEGFFMNFFKTGQPENTAYIIDGKKQGSGYLFYPDGSLKSYGPYRDDVQSGFFWLFDKNGNLKEKREYVTVSDKTIMNQWIQLDGTMRPVFAESNFITAEADKDTIHMGETYNLNVTLEASFNKEYMALIVGPFNEVYQLPAGATCDTLIGKNFTVRYTGFKYKKGKNTLRAVVKDLSYDKNADQSKMRSIWFTKEFYVTQ